MLATDIFPCEDGHAQERSLVDDVLWQVEKDDLWITDRNLCTRRFAFGVAKRQAFFIVRHHKQMPFEAITPLEAVGRIDTGMIYEQQVYVTDEQGHKHRLRRTSRRQSS